MHSLIDLNVLVTGAGAGIVTPKIYYHDEPDVVWSAGSRFRRFPPVIVMKKTRTRDDGRFDKQIKLEFTTLCMALLSRKMLAQVGLLDPNYWVYMEDYDLCLRAREAGYRITLSPEANVWHKVSRSTRAGSRNPAFWRIYGRSEALFMRKHANHRWMTSSLHILYVILRFIAEGKGYGLQPFIDGYREGSRELLVPPPHPTDPYYIQPEILRPLAFRV